MKSLKIALSVFLAALMLSAPPGAAIAARDADGGGRLFEILRMGAGTSAETFVDSTNAEFSLGAAAADAARAATGADIAVVLGGDLLRNIQSGAVYPTDVSEAFARDRVLGVAEVSAAQLFALLEHGFSHVALAEDETIDRAASSFYGFPQVSGLRVTYDASAPPYGRITELTLDGGETLAPEDARDVIRLAAPAELLDGIFGYPPLPYVLSGATQISALSDFIASGPPVYGDSAGERVRVIGDKAALVSNTAEARWMLFAAATALAAILIVFRRKKHVSLTDADDFMDSHVN
ncbi:MAG: 5'-nucleotidase C-terminal domain-containing protein [Oscillospiraceae bacterium]|jgi:hypothetical protein|nr:5'-nucleotidase C-terminal domain-containing protein [Oscillospiraceae bacterium]